MDTLLQKDWSQCKRYLKKSKSLRHLWNTQWMVRAKTASKTIIWVQPVICLAISCKYFDRSRTLGSTVEGKCVMGEIFSNFEPAVLMLIFKYIFITLMCSRHPEFVRVSRKVGYHIFLLVNQRSILFLWSLLCKNLPTPLFPRKTKIKTKQKNILTSQFTIKCIFENNTVHCRENKVTTPFIEKKTTDHRKKTTWDLRFIYLINNKKNNYAVITKE